jgi:hypothetical protein
MSLLQGWRDPVHTPTVEVYVGEQRVQPTSITLTHTLMGVAATCTLGFAERPATSGLRVRVRVLLGWNGYTAPAFTGMSEESQRGWFPHAYTLSASGYLRLMQYPYPEDLLWLDASDQEIATELLELAGVPVFSVEGSGMMFGVIQRVLMEAGRSTWDMLNQLDQVTGYHTFDTPDGTVRRRRVSGFPSSRAAFRLDEGVLDGQSGYMLALQRPRSLRELNNQVLVTGLNQGAYTPMAQRQADSPFVPDPPRYLPFEFRSDLLETIEQCEQVAERLMYERNHIAEELSLKVAGNPYLIPGITVEVASLHAGIPAPATYLLQQVTHTVDGSGFWSQIDLRGGLGAPGEPGDPYGPGGTVPLEPPGMPEGAVTWSFSREGFAPEPHEPEGEPVILYTYNGDGAASYSPSADPETLAYEWRNNKNGDTSTHRFYGTAFTQHQMEVERDCQIVLKVTDDAGASREIAWSLTTEGATARHLYAVGNNATAYASADGGIKWKVFTTPERVIEGAGGVETVVMDIPARVYPSESTRRYRVYLNDFPEPYYTGDRSTDAPRGSIPTSLYNQFHRVGLWWEPPPGGWTAIDRIQEGPQANWGFYREALGPGNTSANPVWLHPMVQQVDPTRIYYGIDSAYFVNASAHHAPFFVRFTRMMQPTEPDGNITCCAEIGGDRFNLFGTSDGRLFLLKLADDDVTWSFNLVLDLTRPGDYFPAGAIAAADLPGVPAGITAVWINEVDQERWSIGTGNGRVYRRERDGSWRHLPVRWRPGHLIAPVLHISESPFTFGEYRVAMGSRIYIGHNDFQWYDVSFDFSQHGTAIQSTLSPFANYGIQRAHSIPPDSVPLEGEAVDELGQVVQIPVELPPVPEGIYRDESRTLATGQHHIREASLWAITRMGAFLQKHTDESAFSYVSTIPRSVVMMQGEVLQHDGIHRVVRDGAAFLTIYAGGARGIHKTWNGGQTWRKSLDTDLALPSDTPGRREEEMRLTAGTHTPPVAITHVGYGSPPWRLP